MARILIIAPHIDDEAIGCWSVISNPDNEVTVVYLKELTVQRRDEARCVSKLMPNVTTICLHLDVMSHEDVQEKVADLKHFNQVYVPSRRDWHPDHKLANRLFCRKATHFYSVDMGKGKLLPDAEAKRVFLDRAYPSQASLWANDDKYWLFEDIQTTDHVIRQTLYASSLYGQKPFEVTVDDDYVPTVSSLLMKTFPNSMIDIMDALIEAGVEGKIEVKDPNSNQSMESY